MGFDLTGSFLIATPAMGDPRFQYALVYLCAHGPDGAFGLVVNRAIPRLRLAQVLEQVGIEPGTAPAAVREARVVAGGPVEGQRGFVLHSGADPTGQALPGGLVLSASLDMLRGLARGQGPDRWLMALGYAGWGAGQLEGELADNAWLTSEAAPELIFDPAPGEHQWRAALKAMGIEPLSLSATAGRA